MHRYFIEDSAEKIYAVYHEPVAAADRNSAVLLIYPDGQEYMRSHRMYMQIAKELCRVGFHVLRFDFYGTGDSSGDHAVASLARWQENVSRCAEELMAVSGARALSVFAARLGATIASNACITDTQLQHFIALDPVLRPSEHLDGKLRQHHEMLADLNRFQFGRGNTAGGNDLLGYEYSAQLSADLRELRFKPLQNAYQSTVVLTSSTICHTADFDVHGIGQILHLEQVDYHWDDIAALEVLLSPGMLPRKIADLLG